MKRIICTTAPWAYGSTTTLITIARHLKGSTQLIYLGGGIALEAARGFDFDDFVEVDVLADDFAEIAEPLMREADLVLSVMNFRVSDPAISASIPCLLADGLGWMWNRPVATKNVTLYVLEQFPGLDSYLNKWREHLPPYEVVGPIVETRWTNTQRPRKQLVVNFSGLRQYLMPQEVEVAYGTGIWNSIYPALSHFDGEVLVAGGVDLMKRLKESTPEHYRVKVRFSSLSHESFLKELDACTAMISAAGLRAIYEAFTYGKPSAFVPPQNMSQELTIKTLRNADAAPFSLTWGDIYGLQDLTGMEQVDALDLVNDSIMRFSGDLGAQERLTNVLIDFLNDPLRSLGPQISFMASLPQNGAPDVAALTMRLMG